MTDHINTPLRLAALPADKEHAFALRPDADARAEIAKRLGLSGLRKLSFTGKVIPEGRSDWRLEARLGATLVQPCVVTLDPVSTRIDEDVTRRYLAQMPTPPEGEEAEMPEDDTEEPLPEALLLDQVMEEALALLVPLYPRAADAHLDRAVFTEPGKAPMLDEDAKPFAGLAALKKQLGQADDENPS